MAPANLPSVADLYVDKILDRITTTAPPGADLTSWRY